MQRVACVVTARILRRVSFPHLLRTRLVVCRANPFPVGWATQGHGQSPSCSLHFNWKLQICLACSFLADAKFCELAVAAAALSGHISLLCMFSCMHARLSWVSQHATNEIRFPSRALLPHSCCSFVRLSSRWLFVCGTLSSSSSFTILPYIVRAECECALMFSSGQPLSSSIFFMFFVSIAARA